MRSGSRCYANAGSRERWDSSGKTASIATLGGVKYTSRREAQTKAVLAEAKLAKEQAKAERERRRRDEREEREAKYEQAAEHEGQPWWRQPTLGAALKARKDRAKDVA
jgi:hypothetical protein